MSHDMFSDIVSPAVTLGSRAWYTVPLSIAAHVTVAAIVIVAPLMATDVLPKPAKVLASFVASPSPPVPPLPTAASAPSNRHVAAAEVNLTAPIQPPEQITEALSPPALPTAGTGVAGVSNGVFGGTGSMATVMPVPSPPLPTKPIPVGGHIKNPAKIRNVRPVYPAIAQSNRVEGRVIIEATIGADGRVKEARLLKSIPLLDRAALDAVMQWQFTPTLLNGVPVPVIMTVTVDFSLS